MIEINKKSREFDEIDLYAMTLDPGIQSIKEIPDGQVILVADYIFFSDIKEETGEKVELMSIMDENGIVYACQSKTFQRSMMDMFSTLKMRPVPIQKISGTTNAGRDYINCKLDLKTARGLV